MAEIKEIDISKVVIKERIRNDLGEMKSLQDSLASVGLIHPIAVNSSGGLITGYRRLIAAKNLGWNKIKATFFDGLTELDEFDIELQENLKRKDFNPVELAEALSRRKKIYEKEHPETKLGSTGKGRPKDRLSESDNLKDRFTKDTAQTTGISETVIKETLQLTELPEPLKEKVKSGQLSKSRALKIYRKEKSQINHSINRPSIPDWVQYTNLWHFSQCDPRFGIKGYPGRLPGQIMQNLLYLFTSENDWVLVPFAGSGTEIDVAESMNRNCQAYDINPAPACSGGVNPSRLQEKEITKLDVTKGIPDIRKYKLIFLDPPYSSQKKGHYTDLPTDLSNMSLHWYYKAMEKVINSCKALLTPDGYLAVISSSLRKDNVVYDIPYELAKICEKTGLILVDRIIVPYENASSMTPQWIQQAKKKKFLLRSYRDLLVYRNNSEVV